MSMKFICGLQALEVARKREVEEADIAEAEEALEVEKAASFMDLSFEAARSIVIGAPSLPNYRRLVLGCIEADLCNQIFILQHFSRFTRLAHFCSFGIVSSRNHEKRPPSEHHPCEKQCTGEKATERGGAWKEGGRRKHATNGAVRSIVERRDARGQYERHRAGQHRGMEI